MENWRENKKLLTTLERMASSMEQIPSLLKQLGEEPEILIEGGPPLCPHCGAFNPEIEIENTDGSGPIFEYYMKARCQNCSHTFYAIPQTWHMFTRISEVEAAMRERLDTLNG
jgi:hypothetical protein